MSKVLLIVLAIVGVLALTCLGGLVIGGVWLFNNYKPPEGIRVNVDAPVNIAPGETFTISVTVANDLDRTRELLDIGLWSGIADLRVISIDPPPAYSDMTFGIGTYSFNTQMPPRSEITITFDVVADAPGVYAGSVDVSVDSMLRVATTSMSLSASGDAPADSGSGAGSGATPDNSGQAPDW